METKWLEDFVSLAETRSFSRSAQLRHVTQPAFSRRIQALEAWAGTDLVDRSSYPTRLTPAGTTLYDQALEVLQALQNTRAMLRGHSSSSSDMIEFAVPHTLAFTFFPAWVSAVRADFGPLKSRLIALNVHDAVMRLVEGGCDLLISYHHPSQPLQLDPERYDTVTLGQEVVKGSARKLRRLFGFELLRSDDGTAGGHEVEDDNQPFDLAPAGIAHTPVQRDDAVVGAVSDGFDDLNGKLPLLPRRPGKTHPGAQKSDNQEPHCGTVYHGPEARQGPPGRRRAL